MMATVTQSDEVRLIARVARLYYESGLKQPEIARRLQLSQPKVSRLLKQAVDRDIVRITVRVPVGVHAELEEGLESTYGLLEAVVVETSAIDEAHLMRDLGHAAAFHLETTIQPGDVIGISSWSASLLATVNAMHPVTGGDNVRVVQILGGVGNPAAEVHATQLTGRLAALLNGEQIPLPVPGVVGSNEREKFSSGTSTCNVYSNYSPTSPSPWSVSGPYSRRPCWPAAATSSPTRSWSS